MQEENVKDICDTGVNHTRLIMGIDCPFLSLPAGQLSKAMKHTAVKSRDQAACVSCLRSCFTLGCPAFPRPGLGLHGCLGNSSAFPEIMCDR